MPTRPAPTARESTFVLPTGYQPYPQVDRSLAPLLGGLAVEVVAAVQYICRPVWRLTRRTHPCSVLMHCLDGRCRAVIDRRRHDLSPGATISVPSGEPLAAEADRGQPPVIILVHLQARLLGGADAARVLGWGDRVDLGVGSDSEALLREACREAALRAPGWERGAGACLERVVLGIVRRQQAAGGPQTGSGLARLTPAVEAMRDRLADPLSVPALAALCGLSEPQFRRCFAAVMGSSPVAWQRRMRMDAARRLLDEGRPVAEVAAAVGYGDASFFSATFRRFTGLPPGRWRRGRT